MTIDHDATTFSDTKVTWSPTVRTAMQQIMRQHKPASETTDPVLLRNAEGEVDILTIATNGAISWTRRDSTSPSGWSARPIKFHTALALQSAIDFRGDRGNAIFAVSKPDGGAYTFSRLEYSASRDQLTLLPVSGPIHTNPALSGIEDLSVHTDDVTPDLFQLSATVKRGTRNAITPLSCYAITGPASSMNVRYGFANTICLSPRADPAGVQHAPERQSEHLCRYPDR